MRAQAKKTPMCSVSLIAIELKGLAAPGEALNIKLLRLRKVTVSKLSGNTSDQLLQSVDCNLSVQKKPSLFEC